MKKYYNNIEEVNNFKELINRSVKLYGEEPVFKFKKRMYKKDEIPEFYTISYNDLKLEIDAFGTALSTVLDVNINERVALLSKNRYEWISVYYAVTTGAKVIVPLDKSLPDNEIISLAARSEAKVLVFEKSYAEIIKKIKDEKLSSVEKFICLDLEDDEDGFLSYKKLVNQGKELLKNGDKSHLKINIDSDKTSIILFTSGTTSISKAVMLSQKNVCSNVISLVTVLKFTKEDSTLALLPFHHAFQTVINHILLYSGASLSFNDGLKYIQTNLCEYKPTIIVCVPLILESINKKMVKTIEKQGKTKLVNRMIKLTNVLDKANIKLKRKVFKDIHNSIGGNVRLIVSGAAAMDQKLIKSFNGYGIRVIQGYGLTETSPIISVENDFESKVGSVGTPIPDVEVKIDNPNEKGIGEIVVKGPNVMKGYYNNNEATEEVLKNGWFYTGDLGYLENNYLCITGRKKNVIVQKNGKNIFPEELEILIGYIPGVKENMVYGKPTQDDDLDVCVKIVYNPEDIKEILGYVNENDIYNYMKEKIAEINKNMPPYKHIRDIIVTDEELIKTTTAKVKRFEEIAKILGTNK